MKESLRNCATAAVSAALLLGVLTGGTAAASAPRATSSNVLLVYQSPGLITEQSSLSVSLEVASSTNIQQVFFTFCQLDSPYVCYLPVTMTSHGSNWFEGSTYPMTSYSGMAVGVRAGYNITIAYKNNTNVTEPSSQNPFRNLTVARTVAGAYDFEMIVSNQVYGLSGRVSDSATGAGISGAVVTLTPGNGTLATTTATGSYGFASLSNGTYSLSVTERGYRAGTATLAIAGKNAVQDIAISNSTAPPGHNGSGVKGVRGGFFSTALGWSAVVIAAVVIGIVALVAISLSRRRNGDRRPPTTESPGPPTMPSQGSD